MTPVQPHKASYDLFKPMIQSSSAAMIVLDPATANIEVANDYFRDIAIGRIDRVEGNSIFTVWPEVAKKVFTEALDEIRKTKRSIRLEKIAISTPTRKNPVRYFNFTLLFFDLSDADQKILVTIEDVSDEFMATLSAQPGETNPSLQSYRDREETFRLLIENSKDGISLTDLHGITIYISPAAQKILGYSETEIAGSHGYEHIHPEDVARLGDVFRDFQPGKSVTYEMRVKHKNGKYRWIEVTTTNLLHIAGVEAVVSNFRDITDRKEHEQGVQQREKDLLTLANAMPQLVWIADANGTVIYYNDRISEYAGAEKNAENQWTWDPLVHPDDRQKTIDAWTASVKNKKTYSIEHRVKMKDGSYRYHLSRAYPQRSKSGDVEKWFGTATDIDEQKEAQQLLEQYAQELSRQVEERTSQYKKQKDFAEIVLDSSVDLVAVYDPETRLVMANRKFYEKFNLEKENVTGKKLFDIFPGGDEGHARLEKALEGESTFYPAFSSSYSDRLFETYVIPLKDEFSQVYAVLVIAHDVTQSILDTEMIRHSAEKLKTANESLVKQNEALEQFAYVASHDLQEPLRKILTFARMLERNPSPHETERYIQKIIQSSNRMSELIRDVLKFSQLTKPEDFIQVDLNEILTSILTDLELLIEQKKARIMFDRLPTIQAVRRQMIQLFYNMISNSLKFSKADHPIQIEIRCRRLHDEQQTPTSEARYYKITFSDNGIGFNQSYADKIFMMFQRLNTRDQFSGSGIGLAMVKKIIDNHHGYIVAEGIEGSGATFHVILPERQNNGNGSTPSPHE
jgi:PAS domain S-box-containing protein